MGMAVVGDEVMVCDRGKNCTIHVFSKELEHVRQITSHTSGQGTFNSLSSDEHGHLYVCYSHGDNSCIQVFGEFLHSFGCDGTGVNKLASPIDICIVSPYIYICSRL